MSRRRWRATGLIQPGSLVIRWMYQRRLRPPAGDDRRAAEADAAAAFPQAGFEIRTRMTTPRRAQRNLERFSQFLTLVGLTALLVGGVGVANAVASLRRPQARRHRHPEGARRHRGHVFACDAPRSALLALVGTAIGLARRRCRVPFGGRRRLRRLPVAVGPRGARRTRRRGRLRPAHGARLRALAARPRPRRAGLGPVPRHRWRRAAPGRARVYLALGRRVLAVAAAGRTLSVCSPRSTAPRHGLHRRGGHLRGCCGLVVGRRHGAGARLPRPRARRLLRSPWPTSTGRARSPRLGRALPRPRPDAARDARAHRRQLPPPARPDALPERAPSFFFLDIPNEARRLRRLLAEQAPGADLNRVPMLRGRFVSLNGVRRGGDPRPPTGRLGAARRPRHHLCAACREGSRLVSGEWWPADYAGPPLVSFDEEHGPRQLGLKIGDERHGQRARPQHHRPDRQPAHRRVGIARHQLRDRLLAEHLRRGAAHHLATITPAADSAAAPAGTDATLLRRLAVEFPTVTAVRVKDALEAV
jgi:putative ABC transport system permease protein